MATYEDTLRAIAEKDERLIVMTAENRAAIRNLPPLMGDRFIDVGIAEMTMIGAAAGLALRGRRPICHALATFLTLRAFEFIRTDVGIPKLPVKLVGGVPGFLSDGNGPTHQAIEDVALMRGIPGMEVFCPADEAELVDGLSVLMERDAPCYIRYYAGKPVTDHAKFEAGKAELVADGTDVAILVYGFLLKEALVARDLLSKRGVSVRLVNVRMPKPIDEAAVLESAQKTRLVVTLEDHFKTGGLFSIVAETLLARGLSKKTLPIALDERWFRPGRLDEVLETEGFQGAQIAARIEKELGV